MAGFFYSLEKDVLSIRTSFQLPMILSYHKGSWKYGKRNKKCKQNKKVDQKLLLKRLWKWHISFAPFVTFTRFYRFYHLLSLLPPFVIYTTFCPFYRILSLLAPFVTFTTENDEKCIIATIYISNSPCLRIFWNKCQFYDKDWYFFRKTIDKQ